MVKTGHTPGPWRAELSETSSGAEFWSIYAADGIAVGYMSLHCDGALEANARLIAAAPDLLDALRDIKNDSIIKSVMKSPLWHKLTSAIEKAEGQP